MKNWYKVMKVNDIDTIYSKSGININDINNHIN